MKYVVSSLGLSIIRSVRSALSIFTAKRPAHRFPTTLIGNFIRCAAEYKLVLIYFTGFIKTVSTVHQITHKLIHFELISRLLFKSLQVIKKNEREEQEKEGERLEEERDIALNSYIVYLEKNISQISPGFHQRRKAAFCPLKSGPLWYPPPFYLISHDPPRFYPVSHAIHSCDKSQNAFRFEGVHGSVFLT